MSVVPVEEAVVDRLKTYTKEMNEHRAPGGFERNLPWEERLKPGGSRGESRQMREELRRWVGNGGVGGRSRVVGETP